MSFFKRTVSEHGYCDHCNRNLKYVLKPIAAKMTGRKYCGERCLQRSDEETAPRRESILLRT